jgi:hypothetical protein
VDSLNALRTDHHARHDRTTQKGAVLIDFRQLVAVPSIHKQWWAGDIFHAPMADANRSAPNVPDCPNFDVEPCF